MKQVKWEPIGTRTDIYDTKDGTVVVSLSGNRIAIDFNSASPARSLNWELEKNERLCRAVEVEVENIPLEAIMAMVVDSESLGHNLTATRVRAWLDSLEVGNHDRA